MGLLIREYVDTAVPVSSKAIVDRFNLGVSSATVRNEMVALTEKATCASSHLGRARATEAGYRYFVQRIVGENEPPLAERAPSATSSTRRGAMWTSGCGWPPVLAQHAHGASLVTTPQQLKARFKHLELISTQGRMALLVLVRARRRSPPANPHPDRAAVAGEPERGRSRHINALCDRLSGDETAQSSRSPSSSRRSPASSPR